MFFIFKMSHRKTNWDYTLNIKKLSMLLIKEAKFSKIQYFESSAGAKKSLILLWILNTKYN